MSHLTREEIAILKRYRNEIRYMPTRETVKQYHKLRYTPWTLVDNEVNKSKEKESKRREKTDDGYEQIGHGYKGFMLAHLLKPSHSGLKVDELEKAQLAKASKEYYKQGVGAAEQYLLQKESPYTIDKELSNSEGLVVVNKNTGKPEMAFRGTDKYNMQDINTDASILFGKEQETEQFKSADNQIQEVIKKYNMPPEHFTGFSLGGSKSLHFGQKYNKPSTNFNPFMGKNLTNDISLTTALQKVIRTTEDPISLGLALSDNATHDSWSIKSVLPLKKNSLNPIESHNLENFTNPDNLERSNGNALNYLQKTLDTGRKQAEYEDLHTAIEAVNDGKTYSEWLHDDQTSVADTYVKSDGSIGLKGSRHTPKSRGMRAWNDAGGSFTGDEAVYINSIMSGKTPPQSIESKEIIGGGDIVEGVPNIGPPEPKSQKLQSIFNQEKTSSGVLPETKIKMMMARGGLPPIKDDGTVTGLYGEQKFIEPEKRADYNRMRDLFNKAQGVVKEGKEELDIRNRMRKLTEVENVPMITDDEINQRNDIIDNAIKKEHSNTTGGLSQAERDTFVMEDKEDRENIIEDNRQKMNEEGARADKLLEGTDTPTFREGLTRAVHPVNLGVGLLAGTATEKISDLTGINKMPLIPKDISKGALLGAITEKLSTGLTGSALTKGGVGLNMGAGAASYLVADATKYGTEYGLKKLGASKEVTDLGSDVLSSAAGGATYGAFLGGAEGAAVGGAVGAAGGVAEYGLKKLGATSKEAKTAVDAGEVALAGGLTGATIGSAIPVVGTAIGAAIGASTAEAGYWLSKLF